MKNTVAGCAVSDTPKKHYLKKAISLLLSLVMLLSITAGLNLTVLAETSGDYEYELTYDGTVEITAYNGSAKNLTIPAKLAGYTVTGIDNYIFSSCTSLTSVIIPNSVKEIGEYAFADCTSLVSINVSSGNNYYSSQNGVLFNKNKTELIEYPIGNQRTAYTIPNSVERIGEYAFADCTGLASVTIPNSVTEIGDYAFKGCTSLASITIPKSVTEIGRDAFFSCISLASITIPNSVTGICDDTFKYCTSLTSITIPNSVSWIGGFAFARCSSLTSVTIPNSVTQIGGYTFEGCTSLTSVTIPNSVTEIGFSAFGECEKLKDVYYIGSQADWNKIYISSDNGALKNAVIHCADGVMNCKHSYDSGKVTKAPTATTAGVKTYTCTKCKATKTETIKATGLKTPTLKATVNANGTFTLSWNKVTGADKYELYIKQADGSYKLMKTTTATSFTTAFATYGKQFSYKMRAVTGNTKSAYSNVVTAKNTKKLQTPALKVAVNANGTFTLSWNKVTGADKYELYIKQADGSYKLMKTTTATSFTTAFATYGKQYSYKMRAVTGNTKSAYSNVVNATNNKKLQTPTLKVVVNANGTFKLSWNKVTGAEKYELYIKQADGSYKLMKTTTATSFTTAFATYGKQFSYKMRAVTSKNKNAASAYSGVVNAKNTKKLQTPTLKVTVNKNGSFKLSWNKVTGAEKYELYIKQANGSYKLMKTTTSTSFTTAVASKGKTYSYKVRAVTGKNKNAASNYSNAVNAKRK